MFGVATINVYASGPEYDYNEKYENIPGVVDCWHDGYVDGQGSDLNQDRNDECRDVGNQYYEGFIQGCKDAGNTKDTCELFTD